MSVVGKRFFQTVGVVIILGGAFWGYKRFFKPKPRFQAMVWNHDQGATWENNPILRNRTENDKEEKRTPQAGPTCKPEAQQRNANAWLKWRRDIANKWAQNQRLDRAAGQEIMGCEDKLRSLNLWNCFTNVRNFSFQATLHREGHALGFEIPDIEYYKQILSYDPESIKLPKELADGIPTTVEGFGLAGDSTKVKTFEGLAKINAIKNWRVVNYSSRTVLNPSSTGTRSYNRLLFMHYCEDGQNCDATTKRYDKYIQFTIHFGSSEDRMGNNGGAQNLVDFISVEKFDKNNQELTKPVIRFAQFYRDNNGRNPKPRLNYETGEGNADTCYTCHPNGTRHLSPLPGSITPAQVAPLQTINDRLASYKAVNWSPSGKPEHTAIHPEYYGPPRGANLGCTDCHNSGQAGTNDEIRRGPLNVFTEKGHIQHKLMTDLSMTQARTKGHLAITQSVKNIDRYVSSDSNINQKLKKKRDELFDKFMKGDAGDPERGPGVLSFDAAFTGSLEMANIAKLENWLPDKLHPDEALDESMEGFHNQVNEDQTIIEQTFFQGNDKRYHIETANWLEERCPDTVEARE